MFYSSELFAKKGALAKLWLAGTVFKKLNKKAILDSSIEALCDEVKNNELLAISICGILTLGIVRIYDKGIYYLLSDASDAKTKLLRMMVHSKIDLPKDQLNARDEQITMHPAEDFELRDIELPEVIDLIPLELDVADLIMPSALRGREEDMELEEGLEGSSIAPEEMDWAIGTHLPIAEEKTEIDLDIPVEVPIPHPKTASEAETGLASKGEIDKGTVSASIPSVPELEQLPQIIPPPAVISEEVQLPTPIVSVSTPEEMEETEVRRGVLVPKKKRKFGYDRFIEFEKEEDQFIVNAEEWRNYLLPARPFKPHCGERPLTLEESKRLFETPMSNRFGDRLRELLAESYRMELSGQISERVSDEEKKRMEEVEFGRGIGLMEMEEQPVPFLMGAEPGLLAKSELGLEEERSRVSEAKEPPRKRRRLTTSVDGLSALSGEERESVHVVSTSETITVPSNLSALSEVFRDLVRQKLNRMQTEDPNQEIKANLEDVLKESAEDSQTVLRRRDVALGFMQTLVLKTANIIDVSQPEPFGPIWISEGLDFGHQFSRQ